MIKNYDFSKADKIYISMDDHNADLFYMALTEDDNIIDQGSIPGVSRIFESYRLFEAVFNSDLEIIFKKPSRGLIDKLKT